MSPRASLDLGQGPTPGTWTLDEGDDEHPFLLLSPEGRPVETFDLTEFSSISGDDHTIDVVVGGRTLQLARLGADGPNLRERLWRLWPRVRARALRLDADGDHMMVAGTSDLGGAHPGGPGRVVVLGHVILVAVEGQDLYPVFLSDLADIRAQRDQYSIECRCWNEDRVVFSRLGTKTDAFAATISESRAGLSAEATHVLAARLPAMPPGDRARLAARWLPGQVLSLSGLEGLVPGATAHLDAGWLSDVARAAEGRALRGRYPTDDVYAGFTRPGAAPASGGEMREDPAPGQTPGQAGGPESEDASAEAAPAAEPPARGSAESADPHLWLLVDRGPDRDPRWILENLSVEDFATYRFTGGPELPGLVGHLLSSPQFSREALYLPLVELTGPRAELAIPARDLGFLRELRARFAGRVIHGDIARWQSDLDA